MCLVAQRDPIQTAKLVASIDQISAGRFLFGIGGGWNAEEMADHGTAFATRFKLMRERVAAMKEIWTKPEAEYHGELVDFPPMRAWPKPVQKPHPPVIVGGAFPLCRPACARLRRRLDPACQPAAIWRRHRISAALSADGGRSRARPRNRPGDRLGCRRKIRTGCGVAAISDVARVVVSLPSAGGDEILPILDRWAELIGTSMQ